MGKTILGFLLWALVSSTAAHAEAHRSDLTNHFRWATGRKQPNVASEGKTVLFTKALLPPPPLAGQNLPGFSELVHYVLPSPDQDEAGSCLYMSLTGIAEWWMARLHPEVDHSSNGPLDFSERYLMNLASSVNAPSVRNWITDSVFFFNEAGHTVRNVDYPFRKGWYSENKDGDLSHVAANAQGATYDLSFNWIDDTATIPSTAFVELPRFRREVLFDDPTENQWNAGVMPYSVVEKVKAALKKNKAPVHILYNHMGYWHANFIVGFDDEGDNANCAFVQEFFDFMKTGASSKRMGMSYEKLLEKFQKNGGCHKGVFYVRDSIYGDRSMPDYDYDATTPGQKAPYSKDIVLLEYDWLPMMANHATQILIDE